MNKEELLKTAQELEQPPAEAANAYAAEAEAMAKEITERLLARADIERLIGPGNEDMMLDNHRNHARFMESVFRRYRPEVLVETVIWVFETYRSHGFQKAYWPAMLDTWVEIMRGRLPADHFSALYPFYDWMIIHQPTFVQLSDPVVRGEVLPGETEPASD